MQKTGASALRRIRLAANTPLSQQALGQFPIQSRAMRVDSYGFLQQSHPDNLLAANGGSGRLFCRSNEFRRETRRPSNMNDVTEISSPYDVGDDSRVAANKTSNMGKFRTGLVLIVLSAAGMLICLYMAKAAFYDFATSQGGGMKPADYAERINGWLQFGLLSFVPFPVGMFLVVRANNAK